MKFILSAIVATSFVCGAYAIIDADNDGMSDIWEAHYGQYNPLADPDGDSYSNLYESAFGTNPNSNTSKPTFSTAPYMYIYKNPYSEVWILQWYRVKGVYYEIKGNYPGGSVTIYDYGIATANGNVTIEIPYSYFPNGLSLAAHIENHSDGDLLTDYEEYLLGTNASNHDTDGDGYSDSQEWTWESDPLISGDPSIGTAIGDYAQADKAFGFAAGWSTHAAEVGSVALGSDTTAAGKYTFAMGNKTTANGESSAAFGLGTIAAGNNSFSVGSYNDTTSTSNGAPTFTVGSGSSATNRKNAFTVYSNGTVYIENKLGIKTTAPDQPLSVKGGNGTYISRTTTSGFDGAIDGLIRYGYFYDLEPVPYGNGNVNRWHGIDATITAGQAKDNKMLFKVWQGGSNNNAGLYTLTLAGPNVGIGTVNPIEKLQVEGNIKITGTTLTINNATSKGTAEGDNRAALVHDEGDRLIINADANFTGGVEIKGSVRVERQGDISMGPFNY